MGAIVLFVITKLVVYCIFCAQAPKWFAFTEADPVSFGMRWGAARLAIGIAAGVPIAFLFAMTEDALPIALSYGVSFVPMRYLEWFVLFKLIARTRGLTFNGRANAWVIIGVAISLALDLFAWTVVEFGNVNLKFFC